MLGEMDMALSAYDMSQQLVNANHLMVSDGRYDVPVAERPARSSDRDSVAAVHSETPPRGNRVDGGSVGEQRDVDAEVEILRAPFAFLGSFRYPRTGC